MTIENTTSVDGIGISKDDKKIVMTIADHVDWSDTQYHCDLLERKLDAYIKFIHNGQIQEIFPTANINVIRIKILYKYTPNALGFKFLSAAKQQLKEVGIALEYHELDQQY